MSKFDNLKKIIGLLTGAKGGGGGITQETQECLLNI